MTANTTDTIAAIVAKAVAEAMQTLAVDPTEPVLHRNAAGRLVDEKGRFVAEPKAKVAKKATAKKATRKTASKKAKAEPKVAYLTKATRKAFIAALKDEFGVDLAGSTTKEVAAYAIENDATPAGFAVGKGYRELVS